jgi:chemotaxis protein methyltransferase CheR
MELTGSQFSRAEFDRICTLLGDLTGIRIRAGKETLVRARLLARLRARGLSTFTEYVELLERDKSKDELRSMVDVLTTNTTSFFRERVHFELIASRFAPRWKKLGKVRIWSAGCSTGQEPYTIAISLLDAAEGLSAKILATDISPRVLETARAGIYRTDSLEGVPSATAKKHFEQISTPEGPRVKVGPRARAMIDFGQLNLQGPWPMHGPFQAIFCRNVMIYFEADTIRTLVKRYRSLLEPGGALFLGHSEALPADPGFQRIGPSVYERVG